jgi:hypothetical protein
MSGRPTTVWVSPSATSYACLCEACLEQARLAGVLFADALMLASVRGTLAAEATVATARCALGHELTLRRIERPPTLTRHDEKQLQLT